jgi:hypothetical protein
MPRWQIRARQWLTRPQHGNLLPSLPESGVSNQIRGRYVNLPAESGANPKNTIKHESIIPVFSVLCNIAKAIL